MFEVHRIEWSSPEFLEPPWRIELVNRDRIGGALYSLSSEGVTIDAAVGADEPFRIEVPATFVRRIWHVEEAEIDELRPRAEAAADLDIALVRTSERVQTVKGKIIGSNRGGAVVESEGVQGFVPLSQLVGPARELYVPGGEDPKAG